MATQLESRLEKLGAELIATVPDDVRAYVFLQATGKSPLQELWRHGSKDSGKGIDGERVIGACRKRQRTVLVYDAEKDSTMRGVSMRTMLSAVCTPILDETRTPIGLILVTSKRAETFNKDHKFAIERMARDYAAVLDAYRKVPTQEKVEPAALGFFYSPLTLIAAVSILLVLLGWSFAPGDPEPAPDPTSVPNSTVGPSEVAQDFLKSLQEDKYAEAWALFDSGLQQRWPSEEFDKAFSEWVGREQNREILLGRAPSRVQRQNEKARVLLFESSVEGDGGRWSWDLTRRDGEWRISVLDGPIQSP